MFFPECNAVIRMACTFSGSELFSLAAICMGHVKVNFSRPHQVIENLLIYRHLGFDLCPVFIFYCPTEGGPLHITGH